MALNTTPNGRYASSQISNFYKKYEHTLFNLRNGLIFFGILFSAALFFILFQNLFFSKNAPIAETVKSTAKLTNAQVLGIAAQHPFVKDFMIQNPAYKSKVIFLDESALKSLALTSPAIYADITAKEIYKVEYTSENDGIMLLVDPNTKSVIKYYRTKEIKISQTKQ